MPQQRRAQVTRRSILRAAAEEFDTHGYEATSLKTILARCEVTKGAFYFHFASKEAVAKALIEVQGRAWRRFRQGWSQRECDPLATAVRMLDDAVRLISADVVVRAGSKLSYRYGFAPGSWMNGERLLGDLLDQAARQGLLRDGVDPSLVARVVCASVIGAETLGSDSLPGPNAQLRSLEARRLVFGAIASPEWLRDHPDLGAHITTPC